MKKSKLSKAKIMSDYFNKKMKNAYVEVQSGAIGEENVSIYINGDWKHDHGYLNAIMKDLGYRLKSERITESDGSDWYSAVHRFKHCQFSKKSEPTRLVLLQSELKRYIDNKMPKSIIQPLKSEIKDIEKLNKDLGLAKS